jgi:hypothetical protein
MGMVECVAGGVRSAKSVGRVITFHGRVEHECVVLSFG